MALGTNYKRIGQKQELILKIRIAQSFLKYNVTSEKELKKHSVNVLIKVLKELHYDVTKNKSLTRG